MALNELTVKINKLRRLRDNNEDGLNDDKIDALTEEIKSLLMNNTESKLKIVCYYEAEVSMADIPEYQLEYIIDDMVDEDKTEEEALLRDIDSDLSNYVTWDDVQVTIQDLKGNVLSVY